MTKNTVFSFLFILFVSTSFAQQFNTAKLDSLFAVLETKDKFMGSIAVSENGKVIYSKAIGKVDVGLKQKALCIASILEFGCCLTDHLLAPFVQAHK